MYQYDDPTAVAVRPASTAAGTAGWFTDGNPAGGVPATILRAEILNMVVAELLNAIAVANIAPSKSTSNQLASTLQALQGTLRPLNLPVTANTTLTVQQLNGIVELGGTGATLTLPTPALSLTGQTVTLLSTSSGNWTVNVTGGGGFAGGGQSGTTLTITSSSSATLVCDGSTWVVASWSPTAASSLAGSGYQKLPSGLILQWTSIVTSASADVAFSYPVAWPHAFLSGSATYFQGSSSSGSSSPIVGALSLTTTPLTTINVGAYTANTGARTATSILVVALGY